MSCESSIISKQLDIWLKLLNYWENTCCSNISPVQLGLGDPLKLPVYIPELQKVLNKTPKKDILVVQGDWNAKIGEDAYENWKGTCGRHCSIKSNERGLDSGSWNLLATMIWWWQILVAPTSHPEKSRGTVQMGKPTIRLITSWLRNDSVQLWTSPRPAAFQEPTLEAITSLLWWPSSYI